MANTYLFNDYGEGPRRYEQLIMPVVNSAMINKDLQEVEFLEKDIAPLFGTLPEGAREKDTLRIHFGGEALEQHDLNIFGDILAVTPYSEPPRPETREAVVVKILGAFSAIGKGPEGAIRLFDILDENPTFIVLADRRDWVYLAAYVGLMYQKGRISGEEYGYIMSGIPDASNMPEDLQIPAEYRK